MIAEFGLRIADLISAAADGWTECLGPGGLSTGGSGDSGEGVELGELRDSAGVAFSRVVVVVDAATEVSVVAIVVSAFILFVFLFVPRAFCLFLPEAGFVCFSERSP